MTLLGFINDAARRVVLLDRGAATAEEEATLRELEERGWSVLEWRDVIRRPEPVR